MTTAANTLVSHTIEHAVATVTINHPPANVLTTDLLAELEAVLDALAAHGSVKVLVVTGAGRVFCAGADVRVLAGIASAREGEAMARRGQAILNKVETLQKPVLAAINGACLGGGLELALCCHIRLAAEDARFGQPEVNLGIMPGFGGTQRLVRLVGRSRAMELLLTGDLVSAQEAKALGLVSQVTPAQDVLRQAQGLARKIASKGQVAIRAILQAIHQGQELALHDGLALEARLFAALCDTEDKREGTAAFLEKRQPRFQDR